MFSTLSIKNKLTVTMVSSIMVATVLSASILIYTLNKEEEVNLTKRIELHAGIASANSATSLLERDTQMAAEILHSLSIEPAIHGAIIYDAMHNQFATYFRSSDSMHIEHSLDDIESFSHKHFRVYVPISNNGKQIGGLVLLASKSEVHIHLIEKIIVVTIIFFITGFIAYLWSVKLQEYIYSPIKHMVSIIREIKNKNNYSIRVNKYYDDEIGWLAKNFNEMLNQIQVRDEGLEKLVNERTSQLEDKNNRLGEEIKNRLYTQSELRESEKKFKSTFLHAAIGMLLVNKDGVITQVNHAVCNMLGYQNDELQNKKFLSILHKEDRKSIIPEAKKLISHEADHFRSEKRYIKKNGKILWGLSTVSGVFDESGKLSYTITQVLDITEEYRLTKELSYQASHDVLTGLINRREFEKRVHNAWNSSRSSSDTHVLSYIDLDQFKVINDTCGHVAGDEMLRQIALLLRETMRKGDAIARLGGDEFGVLIECCNLKVGLEVIENIRRKIESFQFHWDDNRFKVASSIGVVQIDASSSSVIELLKQADTACFVAKDEGRNRISVYHSEDELLSKRRGEMQWINRIQRALDENRMLLNAQPIVPVNEIDNGIHVELLVRLVTRSGEEVLPGSFMPSAERYGLSPKIDHWVVNHMLAWMDENSLFVRERINIIAINLSGLTLSDESFLSDLIDEICSNEIPTEKLCFEITETALIANLTKATKFIQALRRLGCKFALDDFGSGLSSFAYLKNLQVDYLKIDGMFVRDILSDPVDFALVKSINEVGKVMGKKTIAEFVESKEIFEQIKNIGVDFAQGYYVGDMISLSELVNHHSIHKTQTNKKLRVIK